MALKVGAAGLALFIQASCQSGALDSPGMAMIAGPRAAASLGVEWRAISSPDGVVQLAIARPRGTGPFPTVILLHGTHGFAAEYVQLASELSESGYLAIVPCWFAPGGGVGMKSITPLPCPADAPALTPSLSAEAMRTLGAVIEAVRGLPDARRGQIALFGHSRGAGLAVNYLIERGGVDAVIANSSGYPESFAAGATRMGSPLLMLHGEADDPGDGGSPMTAVGMARAFQAAALKAGKSVEAHYFPGGLHDGIFAIPEQRKDELVRMIAFLRKQFRA
jgi:dienelactone hydrolase